MIKQPIIDIDQDPGLHRRPVLSNINKPPMDIPKFHWKTDKPDKRDYLYKPTTVMMPSNIDLRPYCSPVENQGNLGSCTGQAIAGAIELLNKRAGRTLDISRLFIYYYERLIEGTVNYDSGAYIRDGIKACYTYGAPLESLWPYNISKFKIKPNALAIADARTRKVTLYERAIDFNAVKDALANGYPVTIGFKVYSSFTGSSIAKTGVMSYPNVLSEKLLGGHAVLIVGYNDATQQFIVRNSWGSNWGDKGYFYMPYRVIQNTSMSGDFWVIKSVRTK
jgi:C1A family cysteine protease